MKVYFLQIPGDRWHINGKWKIYDSLKSAQSTQTWHVNNSNGYVGNIYEVDLDKMHVNDINNYVNKKWGLTIGNLIDHLITDHENSYPKGYSEVYPHASSFKSLDDTHHNLHRRKADSEDPVSTHLHLFMGDIIYLEKITELEISPEYVSCLKNLGTIEPQQ